MTTASAIASLSSLQLPEKREQPACSTPISRWQWLDRLDSNNRRILAPHVAIGVKAFADLAKESHLGSSGAWQAVTTFFYSVNILLIPNAIENLVRTVTRLKNKQNWSSILALRNIRTIFQSSLSVIVPTTFASIGLKDACQMLGHTIKPLELVLNAVVPWVKRAGRIAIFFQMYDIFKGFTFGRELKRVLAESSNNRSELSAKALEIIENYRYYLQNCHQRRLHLLKYITEMHVQLVDNPNDCDKSGNTLQLNERIRELANQLLRVSNRYMRYQIAGLIFNLLNLATNMVTHSVGVAALLFGSSMGHVTREIYMEACKS